MKVFEAISKLMVAHGAETVFGLIGDANLYMVDSYIRGEQGKYIAVANEANAVLMALAYAQVTGKTGVAVVTHGPGFTNCMTPLVEGVKGNTPIVLFCGDTDTDDKNHLQKINQREFALATGAGFEQVTSSRTLARDIGLAFHRAASESRPIILNIPVELQWQDADIEFTPNYVPDARYAVASSEDLDNAIGIIAAAKRPIILAGRGAIDPHSQKSLIRLADRIGGLLATTLKARDLFRDHPFNIGIFGTLSSPVAVEAIAESDCIIAFGSSLHHFTTAHGGLLNGKRVIQCSLDRGQIARTYRPDAGLVGDAGRTADMIIQWLDEAEIPAPGIRDEDLKRKLAEYTLEPSYSNSHAPGTVDIRTAMLAIEKALPEDRIVVTDAGRFLGEAWRVFSVKHPRDYVHTVHFGSIGFGVGQAIGACVGAEGKTTLLVAGDGGFMLGGFSEFHTAVRNKLDLVVLICNDGSYGAEHIQFRNKDMDPSISLFEWPNFAKIAQAMDGDGIQVSSPEELELAITAIAERKRPLLIEIKLDPDNVPPLP